MGSRSRAASSPLLGLLMVTMAGPLSPAAVRDVAVLYNSRQGSWYAHRCGGCVLVDLARGPFMPRGWVDTIVVSGRSLPPSNFLGESPERVARAIASINPRPARLILDSCYSASATFILALQDAGVHAERIVAASTKVPPGGFEYPLALAAPDAERRVTCRGCAAPPTILAGDYETVVRGLQRGLDGDVRTCRGRARPFRWMPDLYRLHADTTEVLGAVVVSPTGECPACAPPSLSR